MDDILGTHRRAVPDAAEAAPVRDPLLHPRSRRLHHRGRANHRPTRRLVARRLATDQPRRAIRLNPVSLGVTKTDIASDPEGSAELAMTGTGTDATRSFPAVSCLPP